MSTITTRSGKGSPLTHNEVDANFTNLNTDKYQSGDNVTFGTATVTTFTSTGIDDNATSTAITIDSSQNATFGADVQINSNLSVNTAPNPNYSIYGLQSGALTHAGYLQANGTTGTALTARGTAGSQSSDTAVIQTTGGTATGRSLYVDHSGSGAAVVIEGGNVGIGTASPSTSLDVVRAGAMPLRVQSTSGTECQINMVNTGGNVQLEAHSGNFTIDADNVGIGTTNPTSTASAGPTLEISGTAGGNLVLSDSNATTGQRAKYLLSQGGALYVGHSADNGTSPVNDLVINSSGNVGIGTASPSTKLTVSGSDTLGIIYNGTSNAYIRANAGGAGQAGLSLGINGTQQGVITYDPSDEMKITSSTSLRFITNLAERMRIDASGNVGIGTTSPAQQLHLSGTGAIKQRYTRSANSTDISLASNGMFNTDNLAATGFGWYNNGSEAMRIDSSGRVGIGTSSPSALLTLSSSSNTEMHIIDGTRTSKIFTQNGGRDLQIQANQDLIINSSGGTNVGIGTSSPSEKLEVSGSGATRAKVTSTGSSVQFMGSAASGGMYIDSVGAADNIIFRNTGSFTERMRIDSSGNLLVGKTSASTSTVGGEINADGTLVGVRASGNPLLLNRTTTDGAIATFRKDNVTVGSIGNLTSSSLYINGNGSAVADLGFGGTSLIYPTVDNVADLGIATFRFDDIYATNGTIQTSDANEKQDIEALSEAETRVAVAAKALLRKFRWKSAVEEKGDEARIHFGIIAQDLKAAFEAEGLDAGRYAMFIHSTWTDEETGEERSRMGVRYSELLAFIIAAI